MNKDENIKVIENIKVNDNYCYRFSLGIFSKKTIIFYLHISTQIHTRSIRHASSYYLNRPDDFISFSTVVPENSIWREEYIFFFYI